MAEIRLCSKCKRTIPDRAVEEGLAADKNGKLLCQDCSSLDQPRKQKAPQETTYLLTEILNEVRSINRVATFEKASVWNVFATVVQCFALGSIVLAYVAQLSGTGQQALLLLGIFFQLMALTFFTLGK